jgi:hypothetical protein
VRRDTRKMLDRDRQAISAGARLRELIDAPGILALPGIMGLPEILRLENRYLTREQLDSRYGAGGAVPTGRDRAG